MQNPRRPHEELPARLQHAERRAGDDESRSESEETKKLYGFDDRDAPLLPAAHRRASLSSSAACASSRSAWRRCRRRVGFALRPEKEPFQPRQQVDKPIAGLLKDLKQRGLLDDTLVVFATEFGRTPGSQAADGRDHHPYGFSVWMAGGGIKGGIIHGATDELGFHAVEQPALRHRSPRDPAMQIPQTRDRVDRRPRRDPRVPRQPTPRRPPHATSRQH
jgi:hypothetical protein